MEIGQPGARQNIRDDLRAWGQPPAPRADDPGDEALRIAASLYGRGLWVPAIRPPTVPTGTARLRVTLSAAHTHDEVAQLATALNELEAM